MLNKLISLLYIFSTPRHFAFINEPRHDISNNVLSATSKASDQPAHTRSLIRAFASCLNILCTEHHLDFLSLKGPAHACLSIHLSKRHIVGNHMSQLKSWCESSTGPPTFQQSQSRFLCVCVGNQKPKPPDKSAFLNIIFLISQIKHMLLVLKRTVSIRQLQVICSAINAYVNEQDIVKCKYAFGF